MSPSWLYLNESFFLHSLIWFHQLSIFFGFRFFPIICCESIFIASLTSPWIGICALIFFEIEDGSTSMWITVALGLNLSSLPVIRSSNLAPTAIRRSQPCIAIFASYEPCMPSIWMNWGSSPGKHPSPIKVFVTGKFKYFAKFVNSSEALLLITPPPAYITGFSEDKIFFTACSIESLSISMHGL